MDFKESSVASILTRWGVGEQSTARAQEFLHLWKECLGCSAEMGESGDGWLAFTTGLSDIRLKGMSEVHCLLLTDDHPEISAEIQRFLQKVFAPGRLVFLLATVEAGAAKARQASGGSPCLVLGPGELWQVLGSSEPKKELKAQLWKLPRRTLIPFSILLSAEGNMFYGRGNELARLREEETISFAIAGPSKVGKTSLVKQYKRELICSRHYLARSTFYVDFHECKDRTPDGWSHFLAMKVHSSRLGDRVNHAGLTGFLRYLRGLIGTPNLILDEMDEVCQSKEMRETLGSLAKGGLCRFVLCGKGELLRAASDSHAGIGNRFELVRLQPLEEPQAKRLFTEPLQDLGFSLREPASLCQQVFHFTGGLPHLIQFYGLRLAETAIEEGTDCIGNELWERLKWDFDTAQYFTSPLQDISSVEGRVVAYALLREKPDKITYASVQALLAHSGVSLELERVKQICDELVIDNILTWAVKSHQRVRSGTVRKEVEDVEYSASYRLANEAIGYYAGQMGYLKQAFAGAVRQVQRSGQAGVEP